jgi:peptide/nickel transport system permease protein
VTEPTPTRPTSAPPKTAPFSALTAGRPVVATGVLRRIIGAPASRTVGLVVFGLIVLLCIFVPIFSPYTSNDFVAAPFQPPSLQFPFGTDTVGRDLWTRTWEGGRVNLIAAAIVTGFVLIIGTTIGTVAGSSRLRWVDALISRITDAFIAFPLVILLLALVVVFGADQAWGPAPAGLVPSMAALMAVMWAGYARVARGQALTLRDSDFVLAARVAGLSTARIVLRHIVPGVSRITLALAVSDIVLVVTILSSLPFLGAGVQPPAPEWGSIMYEGRGFLRQAWWITLLPGAVVAATGLSLSFVADSLLDSRSTR